MTDYEQLLNAVEQYYGSGSDQWVEIAKYGIASDKAESILSQVPGVNVIKNANGKIRAYNFAPTENIASDAINSNTPAVIKSFEVPANTGLETITTPAGETVKQITFKSGMAQAGNFVFTEVVPAIAAAGVGITLGKTFDKLLYNANPDFWDEHEMGTLNPDTWGDIIGTDSVGGRVMNMILGTTPDGKTQAYIDQNALAYIALYEKNKGLFNEDKTTTDTNIDYNDTTISFKQSPQIQFVNGLPIGNTFFREHAPSRTRIQLTINTTSEAKYAWTSSIYGTGYQGADTPCYCIVSNKPFTVTVTVNSQIDTYQSFNFSNTYYSYTKADLTSKYPLYFYYDVNSSTYTTNTPGIINNIYLYKNNKRNVYCSINGNSLDANDFMTIAGFSYFYGNNTISGCIEGTGTQDNAKTPDLSNATTVSEALDALKDQYPELFNNAVTQDVVQPDGSTITYNYVPVAMPETDKDGNPVSSSSNQANPQVNPATATESLLKQITRLIQKDPPVNPPDTGSGNTPGVVIPTGSANALYSIYNPSQAQLNSFGAWLWSSNFVDQLLKLFNDPMQAIIGLHKVFASPSISGTGNIKVGYIDSGVSSNIVGNQYTTVDCGSISISEYFGNVFDYEPYTKVNLYLPFIGIVPLSVGEVMRSIIHVVYHVDVLTGACLAEVKITRDAAGGTLFQYSGNAAVQYPISSGSYMGIISGIMSIAGGVAGTIATGGAAMPVLLGAGASVGRMHTDISHSGSFSGNSGAMGIKKPYLIIDRPQTALAENFSNYIGYPSNSTVTLSSCKGYTKVKEIHLENVPATNNELSDIEMKLKGGVII